MSTLQRQARALGDPTRHEVFRYVANAPAAVGVAELTEHFGLNHNAIRQHLGKLVDAGLLSESTARPEGRGRPRLQYVVNPNAHSRWGVTGPYERLSVMLAELLRTGDDPVEVGRRAGRKYHSDCKGDGNPMDEFVSAMAREGFSPVSPISEDIVEMRLNECPFASAAQTDPNSVCGLHLGLAKGVAEAVGGIEVEELRANDPNEAHCMLRFRITPK